MANSIDGKKVYQYDLEGNYVCEFKNAVVAGFVLGCHNGANIYQACIGNQKTYKGFIWTNTYYIKIPKKILTKLLSYNIGKYNNPIYQYDLKGNFVKEWKNLNDIDINTNSVNSVKRSLFDGIRRSLNQPSSSGYGYFWSFIKYEKYPSELINFYVRDKIDGPFYEYDINGNYIKEIKNIDEIKDKYKKSIIRDILLGKSTNTREEFYNFDKYDILPDKFMFNKNRKIVIQYNKNGDKIKQYKSTVDAQKETGIRSCNISQVCNGKAKTAGGFIWKYKD